MNFLNNVSAATSQKSPLKVRGAGGTYFKRAFRNICNTYNPKLVILTETRLSGERAYTIISSLGFESFLKIDAMGFNGGIWILQNTHNIDVESLAASFYIAYLKVKVNFHIFILTALYDTLIFNIRKTLWDKFSDLANHINLPWLMIGDFNEIATLVKNLGADKLIEGK